jgi:signal transduction histidine kinase
MSTTASPTAARGVKPSTTTELLEKLIKTSTRLQRIRILLAELKAVSKADRVALIVAQAPETVYWTENTERPEPYYVDHTEVDKFEYAMKWVDRQPAGLIRAADTEDLPDGYDVHSVIVLRDNDAAGMVLLCGGAVKIPAIEAVDVITSLLTLVAVEQRTTNNLNKFLNEFAHDQRSNLNVVSMSADALPELVKMEGKAQVHMTRIFDNSLQIGNQIENALSVDRYNPETDEYRMHFERVDLVELRREICDRYVQVAQGKKINFKFPYVRGSAAVAGDVGMITRAITNLIDNAFKFTPEGGTIEVLIVRGKEAMQVVVKDTGPGIAPENIERIFDRQVRIRQTRHTRGLGLGLYIVRNVALKHGGHAWAESTPGQGSTFFLTLPVKQQRANGRK